MKLHRVLLASGLGLTIELSAVAGTTEAAAEGDTYPIVLTPTRLRQSLQDVPASVTVITADMLHKFAIRSIPEALRLVPGMEVTQASGPDYRINYHGTNILVPRRMNVLIDGVSVYQPLFARVDWTTLPIAIDDVDRIEVTRGPDSAAYGPNSLLAIINIISRHPRDVERLFASVEAGGHGVSAETFRVGTMLGDMDVRLTLNHEQDGGFDFQQRGGGGHNGLRMTRVNVRAVKPLGPTTTLDLNSGYVGGTREVGNVDAGGVTFPDAKPQDAYFSATLTHSLALNHEIQARVYAWSDRIDQSWRTCYPTAFFLPEMFTLYSANPAYASAVLAGRRPTGGTPSDDALAAAAIAAIRALGPSAAAPTCGTANQDLVQRRIDLEIQDTYVVSERTRFVAGAGVRRASGSSATFLGGADANTVERAFGNLEYRPSADLAINVGAYAEHDADSGNSFSPRVAANYRIAELQTVRFVWSRGTRTPDVEEQRANWTYTLHDVSPLLNGSSTVRMFESAHSPGGLTSERIRSIELGYMLNVPAYGLIVDVKAFDDELSSLISEKLQFSSFHPTNTGAVHLNGVEVQANAAIASDWTVFANYAYLRNHDATNLIETTQYSRHSGAVGTWKAFANGWAGSIAYYGASGDGPGQSSYGRTDLTLSKRFNLATGTVEASLTARRLDNLQQSYFRDYGATLRVGYDSRLQMLGQLRVSF